jgi:molybdopterin converting factor small subunit
MPVLQIPGLMKSYVENQTEIPLQGETVAQGLNTLVTRYPAIKTHIMDDKGTVRRHINLFVNQNNIKSLNGLDTSVLENDKLILLPSISGG